MLSIGRLSRRSELVLFYASFADIIVIIIIDKIMLLLTSRIN